MTDSTKIIFANHEIRKSRQQKTYFIDWVSEYVKAKGYDVKIEKGSFRSRNIVIGDPDKAKVIFTAHYDTCAAMPLPSPTYPKPSFVPAVTPIAVGSSERQEEISLFISSIYFARRGFSA